MSSIDHISLSSSHLSESSAVVRINNKNNIISEIKCEICQREFKYSKVYKRHLKTHQNSKNEKEYSCKKCSKRFVSKGFLERHLLIHNKHKKEVKKVKAIKSIITENCDENECDIESNLYPYKRLFIDYNYSNDLCFICNQNVEDYKNHIISMHLISNISSTYNVIT